jgi:pimeloyl-ACP methyl ester carboxylesterase
MSEPVLTEEPLQFGESGRLFGILTLPGVPPPSARELPIFVFLSAGLLHRAGPARLHVLLSRELAQMGFSSLRVDLAGTGDSPRRTGLAYSQSVAADFEEILRVLELRLGQMPLILAGLCSGAHSAVRLTPEEPRVVGMVLLDPICFPDDGFRRRAVILKYAYAARYLDWLKRRLKALAIACGGKQGENDIVDVPRPNYDSTREEVRAAWGVPDREQLRAAFRSIRERRGRVITVFTQNALEYYNQVGQLERVLGVDGYQQFCTELFWPQAGHTFELELHRRQLIDAVKAWAGGWLSNRRSSTRL